MSDSPDLWTDIKELGSHLYQAGKDVQEINQDVNALCLTAIVSGADYATKPYRWAAGKLYEENKDLVDGVVNEVKSTPGQIKAHAEKRPLTAAIESFVPTLLLVDAKLRGR